MSIPNKPEKYKGKAIIEPTGVIQERKNAGLHPSGDIPNGAIICYDSSLWEWISSLPNRIECAGWLKGAFLLPEKDSFILFTKVAGFGAPTAVLTLEELIAYGIKKFTNLGAAGGMQANMAIGDIVICDRAIRDEGTSHHYLPDETYAHANTKLTAELCTMAKKSGIPFRKGCTWTTDAVYRETIDEFQQYRKEGVLTVEMEASALFAVGTFRKVAVSSVFAISDILSETGWSQGYHSDAKNESLKQVFKVALDVLSLNKGTL